MSPAIALGAMTLGQLIDALSRLPQDAQIWIGSGRYRPASLTSYRGYYEDVALLFDTSADPCLVETLARALEEAVGQIFVGYKGGHYLADRDTPVWVSADPSAAFGDAVVAVAPRPGGYELVVARIDP